MRHKLKTWMLVPALLLCLLVCGPAIAADEALLGTWELTQVGENEPEDGQRVVYAFREATVRVTIEASGASTSWELPYSVSEDGKLTIEPSEGLGDPSPVTFSYTVAGDALTIQRDTEGVTEQPEIVFARVAG
ncbi:hypothetical protein OT109_04660 [Phycisphaeraceae bacterium D3-23]